MERQSDVAVSVASFNAKPDAVPIETEGRICPRRSGAGSLDTSRATTSSWAVARCQSKVDSISQNGSGRAASRSATVTGSAPVASVTTTDSILQPLHGIPGLRRIGRPGPRGLDL